LSLFPSSLFPFVMLSEKSHILYSYSSVADDSPWYSTNLFLPHFNTVIPYRRFGTTYRSHIQVLKIWTLEVRTDRLAQKVGKELPLHAASYPRRGQFSFTSWQKPEVWHITTLDVRLHVEKN
jgi:hypothetical protein